MKVALLGYQGKVGEIDVHLWRGAYSIRDVRLVKMTGNVPVPFFSGRETAIDDEPRLGALLDRVIDSGVYLMCHCRP